MGHKQSTKPIPTLFKAVIETIQDSFCNRDYIFPQPCSPKSGYLDVAVDLGVEEDEHDEWKDAEDDEAEDVVVVEVVVPWGKHGGSQLYSGSFKTTLGVGWQC